MKTNRKTKKTTYAPLSEKAKSLILGTLLGDGSLALQRGYKNPRMQFRHSEKDKEYFFWKVGVLREITRKKSVHLQKRDGYASQKKLHYASEATEKLSDIYRLTYKKNRLHIRRKWLNMMDELSLAVWWCDDGSLIGEGGRKGVFCTDGFDKESVKLLARYLEKKWGIRTKVSPVSRKRDGRRDDYWRLWIRSQEELKKFLRIILPYIPVRGMLRKVLLLYKNPQFQERWISEVAEKSRFSREVVYEELNAKRRKWRDFR